MLIYTWGHKYIYSICKYICAHICIYTYRHIHMYVHMYTLRKYAHVNIHVHTYMFIHIEINRSIIIYKNVYKYRLLSYGTIVSTKFYFHVKAFFE